MSSPKITLFTVVKCMYFYCFETQIRPGPGGEGDFIPAPLSKCPHSWIKRGTGGSDPPDKSQVIWVSIGNKQLDTPPPGKICPPPPWKMLDPVWNLGK